MDLLSLAGEGLSLWTFQETTECRSHCRWVAEHLLSPPTNHQISVSLVPLPVNVQLTLKTTITGHTEQLFHLSQRSLSLCTAVGGWGQGEGISVRDDGTDLMVIDGDCVCVSRIDQLCHFKGDVGCGFHHGDWRRKKSKCYHWILWRV